MDIVQAAASAYLNVLRAKSIERIQKENLKLTRENLERARIRVEIGAAGAMAAEVVLETAGVDTLDILYQIDNGLPSEASTKSFLRMVCNEQYYLEQNKLKPWAHDTLVQVAAAFRGLEGGPEAQSGCFGQMYRDQHGSTNYLRGSSISSI